MPVEFKTRHRTWSPQMNKWMGDSTRHGKRIDFVVGGGGAYRNRQTDIGVPYITEVGVGAMSYITEDSLHSYVAVIPVPQGTRITDAGFVRAVNNIPRPIFPGPVL